MTKERKKKRLQPFVWLALFVYNQAQIYSLPFKVLGRQMCNSSSSLPTQLQSPTTCFQSTTMADSNFSFSLSNLICNEEINHSNVDKEEEEEEEEDHGVFLLFSETEDEYIEALVSKERSFGSRAIVGFSEAESLLKCARSDSVRWVLKMKACFGFGYQTAYLAMSYFDRFLVHRRIDEEKPWAWNLLSVACLSLAAKMEECSPPALSEYQLEEYQFTSNVIQRMELLVSSTLEWRMNSVMPFAYMGYFASKLECNKSRRKDFFSRAIGFIFSTIEAINLADCRPSTIAAAAILAAYSDRLTKDLLESMISKFLLPEPLETEHVFSCYNVMIQKSQEKKVKAPEFSVSFDVSANSASTNTVVLNNAASYSATNNKRRRLH